MKRRDRAPRKGRNPSAKVLPRHAAVAPVSEDIDAITQTTLRVQLIDLADSSESKGKGQGSVLDVLRKGDFQKYELGEEIGQGSMGNVCLAKDLNCRRTVAMKRMRPDQKADWEDLVRFVEEAQITSQLEHPNIMPVYDLGLDDDGNVYYTMKYAKGVTLANILLDIRAGKQDVINQYPLGRLLTIFQKICDAIAFAHAKHVLHRDLKPQNIMIGEFGEVLVMDLGLAKVLATAHGDDAAFSVSVSPFQQKTGKQNWADLEASLTDLIKILPKPKKCREEGIQSIRMDKLGSSIHTLNGKVMGTPGFMAPEQALNQNAGYPADIYSLGAILYSILTLRQSVSGDVRTMLKKIVTGDITPPAEYNTLTTATPAGDRKPLTLPHCPGGQVPDALSDIAMKAMANNPADRYASVQNLQRDVESFQNGVVWHLVLDDDFSDSDIPSRWQAISGDCHVVDGELRLHGGGQHLLMLKQEVLGDVRIEFECRQESVYLNDISCFISAMRSNSWNEVYPSAYVFQYGAFDNSLNQLLRAEQSLWSEAASPLVRGKKISVCAERVGSTLRLAVDGREIFRVTDPDPLSGKNRSAVGIAGSTADTRFSRIRIYTLSAPWKADLLEFADREMRKGHYTTAIDLYQAVLDSFPAADRLQHAQWGCETARHRHQITQQIPNMRLTLQEAWPNIRAELLMDNDGLALDITDTGISDLEPLRGMPLTKLLCMNNRITSLEPLRGMPLTILHCGGNPITSLEPLQGMTLSTLLCDRCAFDNLEPLRRAHIAGLRCSGNRLGTGLEPLRGQPLTWLICSECGLSSLEPLRGMPLTALLCGTNSISDLEPLRGMPLTILHCDFNRIGKLEPLRGMPLNKLHVASNQVANLEPLRGMPLTLVSCPCNRIKSLEPLKSSPVGTLICANNRLSSLEPFLQNPPHRFLFDCDTLLPEELEKAATHWASQKPLVMLARDACVLLALHRNDIAELKRVASVFRGHRYLFVPKFLAWEEAKSFCERLGGHLATITSKAENEFVDTLLPGGSWFWIGLQTTASGQQWVTGERFSFSTFRDAVVEKAVGGKVFDSGVWSADASPAAQNSFMIEWDE